MILYKYSQFSVYTLESIRSGNVYFARREKLNDPFDCTPNFILDIQNSDVDEFLVQAGAAKAVSLPLDEKKQIILSSLDQNLSLAAVYCVTSDPENELMWAHYGDNHRGIALGWEIPDGDVKLLQDEHTLPTQISYKGRGEILASTILSLRRDGELSGYQRAVAGRSIIQASYFHKNPAWAYEKEYRFVHMKAEGLHNLDAKLISVTYGHRFDDGMIPLIESVLKTTTEQYKVSLTSNSLGRTKL